MTYENCISICLPPQIVDTVNIFNMQKNAANNAAILMWSPLIKWRVRKYIETPARVKREKYNIFSAAISDNPIFCRETMNIHRGNKEVDGYNDPNDSI